MRAIPQVLDGIAYRSRTEARWSRFFDLSGIAFEYESEGFILRAGWYVPDFWLPQSRIYVEVKGSTPTAREMDVALDLAATSERPVVLATGNPRASTKLRVIMPNARTWSAVIVPEFKGAGAWLAQFPDGGGEAIPLHNGLKNCSADGSVHPSLETAGRLQFRKPARAEPDPTGGFIAVGESASSISERLAKRVLGE